MALRSLPRALMWYTPPGTESRNGRAMRPVREQWELVKPSPDPLSMWCELGKCMFYCIVRAGQTVSVVLVTQARLSYELVTVQIEGIDPARGVAEHGQVEAGDEVVPPTHDTRRSDRPPNVPMSCDAERRRLQRVVGLALTVRPRRKLKRRF